ncbi:hypothetical protein ABH926_008451 [Catenulispora sp. GP43]|uniref:DUF2867 domain-containing protein n=1 Tax=Catenulispora sp. GP43 TaxID=3156263 RepID=UPI0035180BED
MVGVMVKARRIEVPVPGAAGDLPAHDYASAFELPIAQAPSRSPQEWARSAFEDAPFPVRVLVRAGWRFPLLFDAAKPGPGQVLGARIASTGPARLVLEQRSPLMLAYNIVSVEQTRIVWVTVVRYRRRIARPLWAVSALIHHRVLPYLLTRAARTPQR